MCVCASESKVGLVVRCRCLRVIFCRMDGVGDNRKSPFLPQHFVFIDPVSHPDSASSLGRREKERFVGDLI